MEFQTIVLCEEAGSRLLSSDAPLGESSPVVFIQTPNWKIDPAKRRSRQPGSPRGPSRRKVAMSYSGRHRHGPMLQRQTLPRHWCLLTARLVTSDGRTTH
jgi:hypothetical protein